MKLIFFLVVFSQILFRYGDARKSCKTNHKIDLQLIVDSSGSVGEERYRHVMKEIADSVVSQLEIGQDKARVGLFKFSSKMIDEFPLDKFLTKDSLQEEIRKSSYVPGGTLTGDALEKAFVRFKVKERKDKDTGRFCFVFTDGDPSGVTQEIKTKKAASLWAKDGVVVYAIGIGTGVKRSGLVDIAGAEDRVVIAKDFDDVGRVAKSLVQRVCVEEEEEKPALVKVDFTQGRAGADSIWRNDHNAMRAFVPQTQGKFPWANKAGSGLPQTVWYQFPQPITVLRFSFSSRIGYIFTQSPTEFELVASNDCKTWETIVKIKTKFTKLNQEKVFEVPVEKAKPYKCYGIKVNSVAVGDIAVIQNLHMWKLLEQSSPATTITPVVFENGHAYADSIWRNDHNAMRAFVPQTRGKFPWANKDGAKLPQKVWYKFSSPKKIVKIGFSSRIDYVFYQSPTEFELVASNDEKHWKMLMKVKTKFVKLNEEKTFEVPMINVGSYTCYGIKVDKVANGRVAVIQNLKMWEMHN